MAFLRLRILKPALAICLAAASMAPVAAEPEADPYPDVDYSQKYRPQFHFTSKRNWLNDPNGMVYYNGEYHLFLQHNPTGLHWANMHWGHAVSKDMVHWKQIRHALYPYAGGAIWSGSGAVDWKNTTGFGKPGQDTPKPIVLCYTHARHPFTQHVAYSIDRGRTWTMYNGNPVLHNQGVSTGERDPRIFRHEPTKKWVMVLCLRKGLGRIFTSDDLKKWDIASDITGRWFKDCPDLFELPIDPPPPLGSGATGPSPSGDCVAAAGDKKKTKWVLYDASFTYSVGTFDGKTFKIEETPGRGDAGRNFSAAQTFSDTPDGRRIQVAWMRGSDFAAKGMPFNQQMSFPCELSLHTTDDGIRLYRRPVKEIESLYKQQHEIERTALKPGENPLKDIKAELIDLYADITMGSARKITFKLRGSTVTYDGHTVINGTLRKGKTVDGYYCPEIGIANDWGFPANRWAEGDCEFSVTFEVHPEESRSRGYSGPNGPVITIADIGSLGLWGTGTYVVVGGSSSPNAMKPFTFKQPGSIHDGKPHTFTLRRVGDMIISLFDGEKVNEQKIDPKTRLLFGLWPRESRPRIAAIKLTAEKLGNRLATNLEPDNPTEAPDGVKEVYLVREGRLMEENVLGLGDAVRETGETASDRRPGAMELKDGRATFRILIDRGSIEIFGNEGRLSMTSFALHEPENLDLSLTAEGGDAVVNKVIVHELKSAWQ